MYFLLKSDVWATCAFGTSTNMFTDSSCDRMYLKLFMTKFLNVPFALIEEVSVSGYFNFLASK